MKQREYLGAECPFIVFRGKDMTPKQRLIYLGWPLEDALTFCFSKRKEGGLEGFVEELEAEAKEESRYALVCRQAAREALG